MMLINNIIVSILLLLGTLVAQEVQIDTKGNQKSGSVSYPITWSPNSISEIVFIGMIKEDTVKFISSKSLGMINLFITPELTPYLRAEPQSLNVIAGVTNQVRLIFFIPESSFEDTLSGTIHVRIGKKTQPQTLKINLVIGGASIANQIFETSKASVDSFLHWANILNNAEARNLSLNWLRLQSNVDSAGLSSDSTTIWIQYVGGLGGALLTNPEGTLGTPTSQTAILLNQPLPFSVAGIFGKEENDFIFDKLISNSCINPSPIFSNFSVTLNLLKNLNNFGIINIFAHGGLRKDDVFFQTGQLALYLNDPEIMRDWFEGRIISSGMYWAITPKFIRYYSQQSQYPNSIVTISSCHSMDNLSMANAFLENGASTYFGWQNTVHAEFAIQKKMELYYRLVDFKKTTGEAFNDWTEAERTDPIPYEGKYAVLLMAEARDLRLCPTIPTAHKITFSSNRDGNFEIYVMNTDGTNQTRLTNNSASDGNPVWSPDGSKIAFSSDRDGNYEIYVMNADGTNPVRLTNNSAADAEPSWSPDGTKIAFSTNRDGIISGDMTTPGVNWEVYVMNVDGINPVNLTNNSTPNPYYNNSLEGDPRWSPDGSKILFGSWRSGDARVWVMNADGTNPTQLSPISWSGSGRWSPDGSKISYSAWGWLYIMNADGTGSTGIMYNSSGISPTVGSWSPDGTKVVLQSNHSGNYEIYTMNSDGSGVQQLTNNTFEDYSPDWSPVGTVTLPKTATTSFSPKEYALKQNFPNPFNPSTKINYSLPITSKVKLVLYNVLGQEVAILVDEIQDAGYKSVELNMNNLQSGVYFYRLQAGSFTETRKLILLR